MVIASATVILPFGSNSVSDEPFMKPSSYEEAIEEAYHSDSFTSVNIPGV